MYMAMWGSIGCLPDSYSGCHRYLKDVIEDVAFTFPELSTVNLRDLKSWHILYDNETLNRQGERNMVGAQVIEIFTLDCDTCDAWDGEECRAEDYLY